MYITRIPNRGSPPAILLREGYRQDGRVKTRTLANLSKLPPEAIELLRLYLKGHQLVPAAEAFDVIASLHPDTSRPCCSRCAGSVLPVCWLRALREPASWCWPWSRLGSLNPRASWRPRAAGTSPRCPPLSGSRTRTPTSCMPRWTGCCSARIALNRSWQPATCTTTAWLYTT